jgi:acetate kinase
MKILVLNSGSSSIKYQVFLMPEEKVICSGLVERIGLENSEIHYTSEKNKHSNSEEILNHQIGLRKVVDLILDKEIGILSSAEEIEVVGHRVVHGGDSFSQTTIITDEVKSKIKNLFSLAPLHNPPNYEGIIIAENIFKKATQVAVFDTAFHQSIPEKAYRYAIPTKFLEEHKVRLYGFHGTSHKYVSKKAIDHLQIDSSKIISIHLGNGCSMTAIENGKSIDHTLGFSPVNGLIMGTRSGDIDHSLLFYLVNNLQYSLDAVNTMLQKESGMLGLTGFSDLRDIQNQAEDGNKKCTLALEMNAYRIQKYIGAYTAIMNGLDALIFTAGIGENSIVLRKMTCNNLTYLGIELDELKNNFRPKSLTEIQSQNSRVKILVIPTNEEIEIAKQCFAVLH